jgi:hypothetical protein
MFRRRLFHFELGQGNPLMQKAGKRLGRGCRLRSRFGTLSGGIGYAATPILSRRPGSIALPVRMRYRIVPVSAFGLLRGFISGRRSPESRKKRVKGVIIRGRLLADDERMTATGTADPHA